MEGGSSAYQGAPIGRESRPSRWVIGKSSKLIFIKDLLYLLRRVASVRETWFFPRNRFAFRETSFVHLFPP